MQLRLSEMAARLGVSLESDKDPMISGVGSVRSASEGEMAYVAQARYAVDAAASRASALLVPADWDKPVPMPVLRVAKPESAFTEVAGWFAPVTTRPVAGIHPSAVIDASATIGPDVHIGPLVVIGPGVHIGARSVLHAHVVLAEGVHIGEDSVLYPHVTVREHVRIGSRVIVHNGAVIGSDGFGYKPDPARGWVKIPQIGIVVVGDDVEIGANVTIDRARFGRTVVGRGVKIDNLVQVAHNVVIGDHSALAAQTGIAGSAILGARVQCAGQSGVVGHITVGEGTVIGAKTAVTKDTPPGQYVVGFPAVPQKEFAASHAHVARLPELKKRVAELEKRLAELERRSGA